MNPNCDVRVKSKHSAFGRRLMPSSSLILNIRIMQITEKFLLLSLVLFTMPIAAMADAEKTISKKDYEKVINKRNQAPVYTKEVMDAHAATFLIAVKEKWVIRTSECPCRTFSKIAEVTGVKENVAGVVSLFTHKTPSYSEVDDHRNLVEAEIAAVLSISLPQSMDNVIYAKSGAAYVMHTKSCVTVFEDTIRGLKSTMYIKPDKK